MQKRSIRVLLICCRFNTYSSQAISQRWRMLTSGGREPYEKEAKQDLVRYHQEMDAFNMNLVRSYKGPEKPGSTSSRPPSLHEVSPSHGSLERRSDTSDPSSDQDATTAQAAAAGNTLADSFQLLLPLLQHDGSTSAPPPQAPADTSAAVFHSLFQQVITQRLTNERFAEVRALLSELEQILVLQLQLEQHIPRPQIQPQPAPEGGVNEACSALLSLVNQLR